MSQVSINLTFSGQAEAAFTYYKSVFGGEFNGLMRWSDMPANPDSPVLTEAEKKQVMHVELPIMDGFVLMGVDNVGSVGPKTVMGNNVTICLNPTKREEADRLFKSLSAGGSVVMPMQNMFWGDYYGELADQFGIRWMINCHTK